MSLSDSRQLPVIVEDASRREAPRPEAPRHDARRTARETPAFDAAYAAQLYGQPGQKRGLRGGAPVLDAARAAYLGAEYSGEYDRRPPQGLIARKAV